MNILRAFSKILKAKSKGRDITVVTEFANASELLKYALALPDTYVITLEISHERITGYKGAYLLSIDADGGIYCEPAVIESDGRVKQGVGYFLIDKAVLSYHSADDFILEGTYKIIGDDSDD